MYLDAKYGLSYDYALLSSFLRSSVSAVWAERTDHVSLFSVFAHLATSPRTSNHVFLTLPPHSNAYLGPNDTTSYTYAEAYEHVLRYAGSLKRRYRVKKGEVVAVDMMNGPRFLWCWFALWSLGAVPAFINYNLCGEALLHCIRVSTARLVLVDEGAAVWDKYDERVKAGLAEKNTVEAVVLEKEVMQEIESAKPFLAANTERSGLKHQDMALLIYTSGTTGLPKPAVVSWGKLHLAPSFVHHWLPLRRSDILYTCMPLYHSSASILAVLSTLFSGSTLSLGRRFSTQTFWPDVRSTHATILQYVGETCRYLLAAPPSPIDASHAVHTIFGNGLRPDVWASFKQRFGIDTVAEFYAATEGPSGMWNKSRNGFSEGAVGRNGVLAETAFLGRMADLVELDFSRNEVLRDEKSGLCVRAGFDKPGELVYKLDAENVKRRFQGYFGNEDATRKKVLRDVFVKEDAWFRTGDVLRRDGERRWWFVDRIGDTFRWKAENVSTAEVAQVLGACDVIGEANVYGVLVPGYDGRAGCAAVVLRDGGRRSEGEQLGILAHHALLALPKFAVPIFIRVTDGMETTGTNKTQKHRLREEGIDTALVAANGDRMYWLRDGRYVRFEAQDHRCITAGAVRL
ncbi:fatty acid transporter protein [Saccharata proteae CBS 121410]|uniref:Very long-chain fatty acid transport protein n=1 Tax=Saccharata proteae CBS 121410 TaxID=1314787 RepID=A0A9P4LWG8_9PEZI|nr:fatty acid transporter protein [Saccharata proteae CBS 121410]